MRHVIQILSVTIAVATAGSQMSAVPQQRPTFRAGIDLVQIDVVVADADGRPVRGLTKDDFQIVDRGRFQRIAAFDEISHERPAPPLLPATLTLDVADNSTARSDRLIVLVLDDLHFQGKTAAVTEMARRVVEELGPKASLALVTMSGTFGIEPTEDRALILAELARFIDKYDPEGRRLDPRVHPPPVPRFSAPPAGERGEPADPASFFGDMTQYRTLEDVARKIGADDGRRKAFIWISGGNRGAVTDPIDGGSVNDWFYLNALGGLLESLRRSSVATYAIATGDFGSDVLRKVADESSGFVMRAEDFDRDLELLVSDLDHYYLLGFYPDDLSDKGYHQLDVRVTQPGVTVRHRRGYRPGGAPAPPKNKTALSRMAAGVLPATDLPLRLHAAALAPTANTAARLAITMEVRADVAPLLDSDGTMRDVLRYEVWAVDLKKKKPTRSVAREVRVALRDVSETPPASEKVTYHVQTSLVVTPGKYQLRAAATSAKLGRGGSVYLQTEMPDFRAGDLQLSLVLGSNSGDPAPIAGNVLPKTWLPLEPSLDREFRKTDVLRLFCDVVKPARTAADVLVELIDGANQGVTRIDERHFVPLQQARLDLAVPIHGLEPGGYIVRVTATNGASRAQREVGFVVK